MAMRLFDLEFWRETKFGTRVIAASAAGAVLLMCVVLLASLHKPTHRDGEAASTTWLCANGHQFTLTAKQLDAFRAKHYGEPVTCPQCGAPAIREVKCPHCGNIVAPKPGVRICPYCGKPLYH